MVSGSSAVAHVRRVSCGSASRRDLGLLVGGLAVTGVTTVLARRRRVQSAEDAAFRSVNGLPDGLHRPVWAVMQAGSLAAVFVTAGVARLAGRKSLAVLLAGTGTAVWGGSKVVKRSVGRGRPAAHLGDVVVRGSEERGLGFPSGHAGVSFALAMVAARSLPAWARRAVFAVAATVSVARVYVGAHLPLDVVGGAAIGVTTGAGVRLAVDRFASR